MKTGKMVTNDELLTAIKELRFYLGTKIKKLESEIKLLNTKEEVSTDDYDRLQDQNDTLEDKVDVLFDDNIALKKKLDESD